MGNRSTSTNEISLNDVVVTTGKLVKFLLSKWLIIFIAGLIGGIAGVTYAWIQQPKYQAVLTFTTDEEAQSTTSGLSGLVSQFGINLGGGNSVFSGVNILPLIKSQKMVMQSLLHIDTIGGKKVRLINLYMEASGMYKSFRESETLKNVSFPETQSISTFSRLQDSVLLLVIKEVTEDVISVDQPEDVSVIYSLTCTSKSEVFSKVFAEQLIKEVSNFYVDYKTRRSFETVKILQNRADSIKREYDAALYGRAALSDANLNPAFMTPTVSIQRRQTDITVLATAYGEILKNLELAKFNLLRETPLIQVIDHPKEPLTIIRLRKAVGGIIFAFAFTSIVIIRLLFRKVLADSKKASEE